jgi:small subunit ribosomal protein S8
MQKGNRSLPIWVCRSDSEKGEADENIMMTDPISDMLTRIRNAGIARQTQTKCPFSKQKLAIAKVLEGAGFIGDVRAESQEGHPTLVMSIRYDDQGNPLIDGIRRVSKPGRRVYVGARDVWKVRNGLGISVISTSKGIVSDAGAREASVGGEVVCEVW